LGWGNSSVEEKGVLLSLVRRALWARTHCPMESQEPQKCVKFYSVKFIVGCSFLGSLTGHMFGRIRGMG
jgi:hypothetical protein